MAIEIIDVSAAPPLQPEDEQLTLYRRHGKWLTASPEQAESGQLPPGDKAEVLGLPTGSPEINPSVRVFANEQRSSYLEHFTDASVTKWKHKKDTASNKN
jgi:hypothetical protein